MVCFLKQIFATSLFLTSVQQKNHNSAFLFYNIICLFYYFQALEYENKQAQKLADMYREQVIQLEDELAKIREKDEVGKELFKVNVFTVYNINPVCTLSIKLRLHHE